MNRYPSSSLSPCLILFLLAFEALAGEIKVVSFNVNLHNQALEKTMALIEKRDADVILIQEATDEFEKASRILTPQGYQHSWFTGEDLDSGGGFAVISKFPIVEKEFIRKTTGMFGAQSFGVRIEGVTIQFVNIHLNPADLPRPFNRSSAMHAMMQNNKPQVLELRNILKRCKPDRPPVIAGDLNSRPSMSAYKQLNSRGFIDAHLSIDATANAISTWKMVVDGELLQARFDYVFHNGELEAQTFKVVENKHSDHALLSCSLRLRR